MQNFDLNKANSIVFLDELPYRIVYEMDKNESNFTLNLKFQTEGNSVYNYSNLDIQFAYINSTTLKNHYLTFKKIDISDADYIFLPNVYDNNVDTIALLKHFKQMLEEKEFKDDLKIIMYEPDYPLCAIDYFANISSIIETKKTFN